MTKKKTRKDLEKKRERELMIYLWLLKDDREKQGVKTAMEAWSLSTTV